MNVAGTGALMVAKLHKLWERTEHDDRVKAKDALDIVRILRATSTPDLAQRLRELRLSQEAGVVAIDAIEHLDSLFGRRDGRGIALAIQATDRLVDPEELAISTITLANDLRSAL